MQTHCPNNQQNRPTEPVTESTKQQGIVGFFRRYGLLLGLNMVAMGAVLVAFLLCWFFPDPIDSLKGFSFICMFKRLTELPCPSCGLTRGFLMMSRGNWLAATQYNLLSVPIYLGCWGIFLGSLFAPEKILRLLKLLFSVRALLVFLALMMLAWGVKLMGDPTYW